MVQRGPFSGMRYPGPASAGSALAPKLLGTYEHEIQPWVEAAIRRAPARVVNLGAGEGYYAVGLALRLPAAEVHAFEVDPHARELCRGLAEANGVGSRVHVHGGCGVEELRMVTAEPALVICDVEGAEVELLDPREVPGLAACEIIVEVHGSGTLGAELADRFRGTHAAASVRYRGRSARDAGGLPSIPLADLERAVDERRRHGLEWVHLTRRV